MTTPISPAEPQGRQTVRHRFVARLVDLAEREDRGAMAALRRSLGQEPGTVADACAIVEPFLGESAPPTRVEAFYLVGGLFGLHPEHREGAGNFGASLHTIRLNEGTADGDSGVERRFRAVLDARHEGLEVHLRNLVKLLHSRKPDVAIDYVQLIRDLEHWDDPEPRVKRRWASGFWGYRHETTDTEPPTTAGIESD